MEKSHLRGPRQEDQGPHGRQGSPEENPARRHGFLYIGSVYGNVGRVPHLGSTICLSMVLPGDPDTFDAFEIHHLPSDQQPLLYARLLLLHANLRHHADPPRPSNLQLWGGLVQSQFCPQPRPNCHRDPGLAELDGVPQLGQDDQLLHPHHAAPHLLHAALGNPSWWAASSLHDLRLWRHVHITNDTLWDMAGCLPVHTAHCDRQGPRTGDEPQIPHTMPKESDAYHHDGRVHQVGGAGAW